MRIPVREPGAFWRQKRDWTEYWEGPRGLRAPHRDALLAALQGLPAFTSLLEIGCGPGVNLWRIQEAFPEADLTGIDVNPFAIDDGIQRFERAHRDGTFDGGRIALCCGDLPEALEASADPPLEPVDVVVSCYALAYLLRDQVLTALKEMTRLATQAIVIAEPMSEPGKPDGLCHLSAASEFRYDYLAWFRQVEGWHVTSLKKLTVDRMNRILVAQRRG